MPADDDTALDGLTAALTRMRAERGPAGWEPLDPRHGDLREYQTWHGRLEIRMVTPFEDLLWLDLGPLPPPHMPPRNGLKSVRPLIHARVAVMPLARIESQDGAVRRMLARLRERQPLGGTGVAL